jgi:hypothetical protein
MRFNFTELQQGAMARVGEVGQGVLKVFPAEGKVDCFEEMANIVNISRVTSWTKWDCRTIREIIKLLLYETASIYEPNFVICHRCSYKGLHVSSAAGKSAAFAGPLQSQVGCGPKITSPLSFCKTKPALDRAAIL